MPPHRWHAAKPDRVSRRVLHPPAAYLKCRASVTDASPRLRDILNMQPGDVIPVDLPEQVLLRANGVPAFTVKLGAHKGKLAFQVLDPVARSR